MSVRILAATDVRRLRGWIAALGLIGLAGCAAAPVTVAPGPSGAAQAIEKRAMARWDALIAGNVAGAYEYLSPGTRQVYTAQTYAALVKPGMWKKARVDRVECPEPDLCQAVVLVDYVYRGIPVSTPLRETWSKSGGEWWYVLK